MREKQRAVLVAGLNDDLGTSTRAETIVTRGGGARNARAPMAAGGREQGPSRG